MFRSTLTLLVLAFATSATAQDFDYNYLQLEYGTVDFDDINVDGDGFGLSGSVEINPDWYFFGAYQNIGLDFGIDATSLAAGIGRNLELSPGTDLYGELSYEYAELDAPGVSGVDDTGLGLGVGIRYAVTPELEIDGGIQYVDFDDGGNDTAFGLAGLYSFDNAFVIGLSGSWSDDVSSYSLIGRYYFGK